MTLVNDELLMRRCIELARNGEGLVAPNPMVGAVIVHEGRIIGEGYHTRFGAPHAEVMAINSVADKSLLKESVIYVNLEPCSHHGKTPPCAQLICDMGIPKVVIAATDPFPQVQGRGIDLLKANGIEIVVGVLEQEARLLNRFFYTYHEKHRPYIILKWAESRDGYIDNSRTPDAPPARITGDTAKVLLHRWRSQVQAIMVGINTVLYDNPNLTVRNWYGRHPLRVIVDRNDVILPQASVLNDDAPTLLFVAPGSQRYSSKKHWVIEIDEGLPIEKFVLDELYKHHIQSLFIEGGAQVLNNFMVAGLWDEARIFSGDCYLHGGVKAPLKPALTPATIVPVGNDILYQYYQNQ